MFIKYHDIKDERVIDVRTITEFKTNSLFSYNIPIINESEHKLIKKFYPMAFYIIIKSLLKNKFYIKNELLRISSNGTIPLVLCCSRGRLRSPVVCIYAMSLGIKCEILYKGIKPLLQK